MNPLDRLAVRLSLTRAEISVISLLVVFLLLGGAVKNFRTARDAEAVIKGREQERLSEREVDSMLAVATIFPKESSPGGSDGMTEPMTRYGESQGVAEQSEEPPREKKKTARSHRKIFNGTLAFNRATEQQLQQIPGVGPVMAKRLVTFRASKGGRIERHEDLLEVKGIGEKKLEVLKKHLTLE
ncbi:MAG: helix-hairpin-helix domain-containing protein [Chlorobi bacterium]|nr:helix-hairpin-helix domain-containing protein [Chlorobiota bacterium]